jgi:hypothetical protein
MNIPSVFGQRVEYLASLVRDESLDPEVRVMGAVELAQKSSIGDLLALARDESLDPHFVNWVISALVRFGQKDAVVSLTTDPEMSFEVRRFALAALLVADDEAVPSPLPEDSDFAGSATYLKKSRGEIESLLQDDGRSEGTREAAEFLLSEAPDAAKAVAIARDPSMDARLRMFAVALSLSQKRLDLIVQLIMDKQADMRLRLATLGLLNDCPGALKEIASSPTVESEMSLRAVYALFEQQSFANVVQSIVPDPANVACLERLLEVVEHEEARIEIRRAAAGALVKLKAADVLLRAASNENMDADFRLFLIQELVKGGWSQMALDLISDSHIDKEVRNLATMLLSELRQADALVALLRRKDIDRDIQRAAVALFVKGWPEKAPDLIGDSHIDKELRSAATALLGKLRQADALVALLRRNDIDRDIHCAAVTLFVEGWPEKALDMISDSHIDKELRGAATVLLRELGQADALVALLRRQDIDRELHFVAVTLLWDMGKNTELITVANSGELSDEVRAFILD